VPAFPFDLRDRALQARLASRVDLEGKVPRALAELGDLDGRRVLLADGDGRFRATQLRKAGATIVRKPRGDGPRPERYVSFWGALHPDAADAGERLEAIRGSLAAGGRILLVHDYGRDDVTPLLADKARHARLIDWSSRKSWFLQHGFKLRVVHTWWTFATLEEARELLALAFGDVGSSVAAGLRRPRLSHKVGVYHLRLG
jgi:hypothetical protein